MPTISPALTSLTIHPSLVREGAAELRHGLRVAEACDGVCGAGEMQHQQRMIVLVK